MAEAQQGTVAERQVAAPAAAAEVQDFSPPKSTTWSDVANKCWQDDLKTCASTLGQKLSESFGFGSREANQQLEREGTLPPLTLIGGSDAATRGDGAVKGDGSDALPKALQGDNKKRTETLMNSKADPQERLKAASELIGAGVTGFTVQGEDGSLNKVRLEKEKVSGDRSMLGVYVSNKNGAELNALRAIEKGDGTLVQQKDSSGRAVDFKNRGAALLDRLSEDGQVVEAGAKPGERRERGADGAPVDKEKERTTRADGKKEREGRTEPEAAAEPDGKKLPEDKKLPGDKKHPDGKKDPERKTEPEQLEKKKIEPDKPAESEDWKSPYERKYNEGDKFKGITSVYWQDSTTASGIRFNKHEHTAASREFPFGTVLNVRNPETGKETKVVITDNGPFAGKKEPRPDGSEKIHNRVLDISLGAANAIGMTDRTPRAMEISVVSIPEGGAWGGDRRNLSKTGKADLIATAKRLTAEGRTY